MTKKMNKILRPIVFGIFVLPLTLQAEDMPDYYEEAGIPAARELLNQNANELIDPFSGTLNIQHVDTEIPGNGGLDIIIQRSYANLHDAQPDPLGLRSPYGVGWSMHFGRVLKSAGSDVCTNDPVNSSDNPTLGLPDGSQQLLFDAVNQGVSETYSYITKQRWKADCQSYSNGSGTHNGLAVWSPEGLKYEMAWLNNAGTALYVTKITDRNGNYINISYENNAAGYTLINSVTSSDNRTVTYSYTARTSNSVRLSTITSNNQTWRYNYSKVFGVGTEHYYLDSVARPDGTTWKYSYNTGSGAGEYSIKRMTYPTTGYVDYTYGYKSFGPVGDTRQTTSVTKKTTSDNGTWLYTYTPGSTFDKTEISTPNGDIEYQHYGARAADNDGINSLWKVGVLLEKSIGDIQVETYTWSGQRISDENYFRSKRVLSNAFDTEVYAPLLTKKIINTDGTDYTTTFPFANYDKYGNAGKVVEAGNASITRTNTYYINTAKWILHELDDETLTGLTGNSTISRTFDTNGNIKSVNRYGATTTYTYTNTSTSKGDIATVTDPASKKVTYSNYKNGIARSETQLEGVSISRVVNATGTIASVTNGESKKTSYGYDSLNRIDSVQRPINSIVSIDYTSNKRTLTRYTYSEDTDYDGFGRPTKVTKTGGDTSVVDINYNALGQKLFESYPNSSTGISYSYDDLGRIKTTAFSGGGMTTYTYKLNNKVTIKDQKGNSTTYTYRSFGEPEVQDLMKIQSPESITTTMTRNNLGQLLTVSQNGKTRTYSYYSNHYLYTIDDPETNKTTYGRDSVGNMTTRKVGASGTTNFTYDGLHRLKTVNYPGATTPDVTYTYDKNSNLKSVGTSAATRAYTYDSNDNLRTEKLTVGGQNYLLTYSMSLLDHVTFVIYPSGRKVTYSTDPKGRQTEVDPFITDITYYPNGQPNTLLYANGVLTQLGQNSRQWMSSIVTPIINGDINLSYSYDNNGNITEITNTADSRYTRKMTYDSVDRLATASGIWGAGTISYEIGGNIKTMNIGGRNIAYTYDASNNKLQSTSGGINHNFTYDTYGNISGNGVDSFTFNDAADLINVSRNSNDIADFQYDGNQSMVTKTEGGQTVHLLYNKSGILMGEYTPSGQWLKENAYLDSKLIAVVKNQAVIPPNLNVPSVDYDGGYTVSWVPSNATSSTQYELLESASPDFTKAILIYQGSGLSKVLAGKGNGEYYYWVRACEGKPLICGIYSTGTNRVSVELPPGVPAGIIIPTLDVDGTYSISWGSASGVLTHYELYEATDPTFTDQTLAAYTSSLIQVLSNRGSNRYYYRIRACYKTGCSDYRTGLNNIDVNIPIGIPSSISAPTSDQDGTYNVLWRIATGGPTYYEVYEANNARYSGESLVAQVSATAATITGKTNGTYYYRVRGCSPFVCGGFIEEPTGVVVNIVPPTAPTYLTVPTVNYSGSYSINWNYGGGDITHYELYESTNAGFVEETLIFQGRGNIFGFTGKATSNATYYYRIRACSAISCSNFTTGSNGVSVKIAPGVPGAMTWPASDDDGRYTLSWRAASGTVTHYLLYEDIRKDFPKPINYKPNGLNITISGKNNGSYIYKVQACNGSACSDFVSTGFVTVNIPTDTPSYINVPSADYSGTYTIDWGAPPSVTFNRYELYEATDAAFSDAARIYNGTNRSFVINKQADGTFYYRVRACFTVNTYNINVCYNYRTGENNVSETIVGTRPH